MKIAVLIAGEYREFNRAFKFWEFNKLSDCVHYYFSTWDISTEYNEKLNINISEKITTEKINDVLLCFDSKIDNKNDVDYLFTNKLMLNRWHSVLDLMLKSNILYDVVILIRPDLVFKNDLTLWDKFLNQIEDNCIYGYIGQSNENLRNNFHMQDVILIGKYREMLKLKNIDQDIQTISDHSNIHVHLANIFKEFFINIKHITPISDIFILRSISRNYYLNDYESIKQLSHLWYQTKNGCSLNWLCERLILND